jgi:hypothetical protein
VAEVRQDAEVGEHTKTEEKPAKVGNMSRI